MTKGLATRQRAVFGEETGRDRKDKGGTEVNGARLMKDLGSNIKVLHPEGRGEPGRV